MLIILRKITLNLIFILVMIRVSSTMADEQDGPARVWGVLSSTYQERESGSGDGRNTNWLNTGTISASSYIWRPWFALVNGSLSLSVDGTDSEGQSSTEDELTTGEVQLRLFPTSRFPFRAYYLENRNQFDDDAFGSDAVTTQYGATQRYRSWDGRHNYAAEYENDQRNDRNQVDILRESLLFTADNSLGDQTIETEIRLDTADNKTTDEEANSYLLTVDHSFGDRDDLSMENLLSVSTAESDFFDSTDEVDTAQLSSFATWYPQGNRDLRLNGSLRFLETQIDQQSTGIVPTESRETTVSNVNQGLVYQYSDNLQFIESVNANYNETEGERLLTASETLSSRYVANPINTDMGDYVWNAGITYNNFHGDIESEQSLNSQFSHSLLKNYSLASGNQLRTNFTQSLSYTYQSDDSDDKSIDHSYSVTWSDSSVQNQSLVRFFISDSRELNQDDDFFQLINLQYTGTNRFSRYSQLFGDITLQFSRQQDEGQQSEATNVNGLLGYRHDRAFRVTGMIFFSELQLSERQTENDRLIRRDSDSDTGVSWENTLKYNIGRLETQVELDFIKISGEYDRIFKFQVSRSFGDL